MSPAEAVSNTKREIDVQVPAQEVSRETETLIQKYQKLARIPGFRSGHAPASIIRQRFKQEIQNDVVDALVPKYFRKETERQGLIPVSQPRVTDLHVHEGEGMHFKAAFDVMPEITVEGYKELRAEHPEVFVTDPEVDDSLNALREQKATFAPVEGRSVADGDYAQVSLDGTPKEGDANTKPVHMDDVLVEYTRKKQINLEGVALLPPGKGWLLAEFGASTVGEAESQAQRLIDALGKSSTAKTFRMFADQQEARKVWRVRESSLGAVSNVPGEPPTWEGWEDSAVAPERLGEYLRALRKLTEAYHYRCIMYGHFGDGCVHNRMGFDLQSVEGIKKFRSFMEEAADLVISFGGTLSGEQVSLGPRREDESRKTRSTQQIR